MGLVLALLSGGSLVAVINLLGNRNKAKADTESVAVSTFIKELEHLREALTQERQEKAELKGENKFLKEQHALQERDCDIEIKKLQLQNREQQRQIEELQENVMKLKTQLELKNT